jgi:hypothetical protein
MQIIADQNGIKVEAATLLWRVLDRHPVDLPPSRVRRACGHGHPFSVRVWAPSPEGRCPNSLIAVGPARMRQRPGVLDHLCEVADVEEPPWVAAGPNDLFLLALIRKQNVVLQQELHRALP